VARPKIPLISKREVVAKALEILDAEGMEALSIRRLGTELNINGASLYHHFANKDEILIAVARAVIREMSVPPVGDDPIEWIVHISRSQRRVLLKHPQAIPLLSRGYLRITTLPAYETTTTLLASIGMSKAGLRVLLEAIEALIVGNVIVALMPTTPEPGDNGTIESSRAAARARTPRAEEAFEVCLRAMIDGVREQYSGG
jgi:AcrR family transcriptional regulator